MLTPDSLRQRNCGGSESSLKGKDSSGSSYGYESVQSRNSSRWTSIEKNLFIRLFAALISLTVTILSFGTIYSNVTSRDACQVLVDLRRYSASKDLPRLFHYQSKASDVTMETKTWMELLDMPSKSQEYPNINSSSRWTGVYWSDESCRKLVEDQLPEFLQTYNSFQHNIQRVDSCRYLILSIYAGVYADTDISIHASDANEFEHLIPEGVGLVESPYRYNEVWQNSLMTATAPGHVFWNITIDIMMERAREHNILSTTGPKMLGDAVERLRQRYGHGKNKLHDVHTLPCELFQRLPLGEWGTTFLNVLGREVLARAIPMQGCGRYGDGRCEITRHAGRASWTSDAGIT